MTKMECIIGDLGFVRYPSGDKTEKKHDGSSYEIRHYRADIEGNIWTCDCDSYYGRAILSVNGKRLGDYESRYEHISAIVKSFLPVNFR